MTFLSGEKKLDLPSWTTDWSITEGSDETLGRPMDEDDLNCSARGFLQFSDNLEILIAQGSILDTVDFVSKSPLVEVFYRDYTSSGARIRGHAGGVAEAIASWRAYVYNVTANPYATTAGRVEAFCRTIIANRLMGLPSELDLEFVNWMIRYIGDNERTSSDVAPSDKGRLGQWSDTVMMRLYRHAFVITRAGYLGLAPLSTRKGDVVVAFAGSFMPFLLRQKNTVLAIPCADGALRLSETYEFIGPTYIHNIIKGTPEAGDKEFHIL